MKHPRVFERSRVIDTAFELIRQHGWKQVTARNVARHLGSSTMPIYSNMRSLEELERELKAKARKLMQRFQTQAYTESPLLNTAVGYVLFARDEKHLFRFLYLERPDVAESEELSRMRDSFYAQFGPDSPEGRELSELPDPKQEGIVRNAHIYTHGLAMLVNAGILSPCSNQTIETCLREAGEAFYLLEARKEERNG